MMIYNKGAGKGLLFFFTPQWEKLASLKVTKNIIVIINNNEGKVPRKNGNLK